MNVIRLARRFLRHQITTLICLALFGALFQFLIVWVITSFEVEPGGTELSPVVIQFLEQQIQSLPLSSDFLKVLGIECLSRRACFLPVGYLHPMGLMALCIFTFSAIGRPISRALEIGTIDLIFARPVKRVSLISAVFLALVLGLAILVLSMLSGTWIGGRVFGLGIDIDLFNLLRLGGALELLLLAVGGIAVAYAASVRGHRLALGLAIGSTVVLYLVHVLSTIWPFALFLGPYTLFSYYDPGELLIDGWWNPLDGAILGGVAAVGWLLSYVFFSRRDL